MCKLVQFAQGKYVADIKYDYIVNIAKLAAECKNIRRIMLFGSATEERCKKESDIDIAVFGEMSKPKYLRSKEHDKFHAGIILYGGNFEQDYDILYFSDQKESDDAIMADIANGVEIYRRAM